MLGNERIDIKAWRVYVERLLSIKDVPLIVRIVNGWNPDTVTRKRLLAASFDSDTHTTAPLNAQLIIELQHMLEGKDRRDAVMDDFEQMKQVDEMIAHLKNLTDDIEQYQLVFRDKKLFHSGPTAARELQLFKLGIILVESGGWGHSELGKEYLDQGFDMNFQHPVSGWTVLHRAMAVGDDEYGQMLMDSGKCDYLLKSTKGLLACDLAFSRCKDMDLYHRLEDETIAQAKTQGWDTDKLFEHQQDGYWEKRGFNWSEERTP